MDLGAISVEGFGGLSGTGEGLPDVQWRKKPDASVFAIPSKFTIQDSGR